MSKIYTQRTAALRATTIDAYTLDTQNISIYPGEGDKNVRKNLLNVIEEKDEVLKESITSLSGNITDTNGRLTKIEGDITNLSDAIDEVEETATGLDSKLNALSAKNFAYTDSNNTFSANNTFTGNNTFSTGISVLPLGATTITGQAAYGLSISPPSADGTSGSLQLWGTHFMQGDEWSDNALKIVHNNLALFGNHEYPSSLSFDNANVIEFKVMPNDGSSANDGQGVIFDFQAWQWDNDEHTTMNANCPVQILKNNSGSLVDRSVLNLSESDSRYSQLHSENTLTETNTFEKTIVAEDGVHASGGDIVISNGTLTFEDLVDGTVVRRSGASGYQYVPGIPGNFENGVCYDIGQISNTTNLSNIRFTGEGRLVQTCELWFTTPATPPTAHQWPTNIYWIDSATGAAPTLIGSKNYRIVLRQEPNKIIASIAYLY